jgi:hypothetical protein
MKLKNDNLTKQVSKLQRNVNDLSLDLQAIKEEHDRYTFGSSKDKVIEWFSSLPIESLLDSIDHEKHKPRTRFNLQDMHHKFALRKLHNQKQDQLERETTKLNIVKIDQIINRINKIGIYK